MVNTLQTDLRETRDLLNWRLLATVLVLAVLPCVLLWRQHIRLQSPTRQAVSNLAALAGHLRPAGRWWWCFSFKALPR